MHASRGFSTVRSATPVLSGGLFYVYQIFTHIGATVQRLHPVLSAKYLCHRFLNVKMPLECLRVLLGHTNLEVTRLYARMTDRTRNEEYFKASERILKGELETDG